MLKFIKSLSKGQKTTVLCAAITFVGVISVALINLIGNILMYNISNPSSSFASDTEQIEKTQYEDEANTSNQIDDDTDSFKDQGAKYNGKLEVKVVCGGVELKTMDNAPTDGKLVHTYKMNDTNIFKIYVSDGKEVEQIGFSIIRKGQTPKFRGFTEHSFIGNDAFAQVALSDLKKYLQNGDSFQNGYTYQLVVRAKMKDGAFSEDYIYKFMQQDTVYVEPEIIATYGDRVLANLSTTEVFSDTILQVKATHRTGIEYIIYYWDSMPGNTIINDSYVQFDNLDKLPVGIHHLYVHAIASSAESTGTEELPAWMVFSFERTQ